MSAPAFILATDLKPEQSAWELFAAQAKSLHESALKSFGVSPRIELACLPTKAGSGPSEHQLGSVIDESASAGAAEIFVLPATLELSVWQRTWIGEELTEARRRHSAVAIHHDAVDPSYPLLVDCFSQQAFGGLRDAQIVPAHAGLVLVASGQGDAATRADSYRLMRLLWEHTGFSRAEVGFVRHTQQHLPEVLERCLREELTWLLVPQCQWESELTADAREILLHHQQLHSAATTWHFVEPPGDHPSIRGWLEQRMRRLWQEKRARQALRVPSAKRQPTAIGAEIWSGDEWSTFTAATLRTSVPIIGRARQSAALAEVLERVLPHADRYLVKVTWHGYAQGTFSGPSALDLLLGALPGPAVVLEGHTSGRNLGGVEIDWESNAAPHRSWIRQQELEFLRRTGLADVLTKHKAQYVNVTETWWDGACTSEASVRATLANPALSNPEFVGFVPSVLLELRGSPLISFARFKGPTRLGISNFFGLIPHPLRTKWHGASIADFASACCDMVQIYGSLFPLFGLVEAFESAVRWDRKGLYRSRWGNYDLVLTDGLFTLSEGLVGADLLASRLQGQNVQRSAFFAVVRDRLGWSEAAAAMALPADLQANLA